MSGWSYNDVLDEKNESSSKQKYMEACLIGFRPVSYGKWLNVNNNDVLF